MQYYITLLTITILKLMFFKHRAYRVCQSYSGS